jgi:hypothetical protein
VNVADDQSTDKETIASGAGALINQIGGRHYKKLSIQPVEYIHANNIPYFEGNVIKYVTRWRDKGGMEDLEKARHYLDLLIELENDRNAELHREAAKRTEAA